MMRRGTLILAAIPELILESNPACHRLLPDFREMAVTVPGGCGRPE